MSAEQQLLQSIHRRIEGFLTPEIRELASMPVPAPSRVPASREAGGGAEEAEDGERRRKRACVSHPPAALTNWEVHRLQEELRKKEEEIRVKEQGWEAQQREQQRALDDLARNNRWLKMELEQKQAELTNQRNEYVEERDTLQTDLRAKLVELAQRDQQLVEVPGKCRRGIHPTACARPRRSGRLRS